MNMLVSKDWCVYVHVCFIMYIVYKMNILLEVVGEESSCHDLHLLLNIHNGMDWKEFEWTGFLNLLCKAKRGLGHHGSLSL
jgi:hypothetical protein